MKTIYQKVVANAEEMMAKRRKEVVERLDEDKSSAKQKEKLREELKWLNEQLD